MTSLATLPAEERALYWRTCADRMGFPEFVVEKDYWVCWLLGHIFATPQLGDDCVFKGGTSLSKVYGAIDRFSEDIDLGLSPASLGWNEEDLDDAPSGTQRQKRAKQLQAACADAVKDRFLPTLAEIVNPILGSASRGSAWLRYEVDPVSHAPVILFAYPQAVPSGSYIAPVVKLEFGSLTDQRPKGTHSIAPFVADLAPELLVESRVEVVALEIERTFWEKATILHAEYHRPAAKPIRDRFVRHYSDFVALWNHPVASAAASRLDLLERVRVHKDRYFRTSWANYNSARPGTLRLVPPDSRLVELRRDYAAMEPMFHSSPPAFEAVLDVLGQAEQAINTR